MDKENQIWNSQLKARPVFIAMNRFNVPVESAEAFEALWLNRDSHLNEMHGFIAFQMLKGPEADGLILYASHTVWASEDAFTAWTRSAQFRAAHRDAGQTTTLYDGHPHFEGFTVLQSIAAQDATE